MGDSTLTYKDVNRDILKTLSPPGKGYWLTIAALFCVVGIGGLCFLYQAFVGMGAAGINNPVGWGTYIITFVFWVGIAHSGTLISAVLFLFRAKWRTAVYRVAEAMTNESSVSSNAIVATEEGKNCGVSAATTNPWSAPVITGEAGLSEIPIIRTPCSFAMPMASSTSRRYGLQVIAIRTSWRSAQARSSVAVLPICGIA